MSMKRLRMTGILLASMLIIVLAVHASVSAAQAKKISVLYNGQAVTFEEAAPVMKDGRTLVPFRKMMETLGFKVKWAKENGAEKAIGTKNGLEIILTINDKTAIVNGRKVALDVPAQVVKGSTMVPLRFVSENSGYDVEVSSKGSDRIIHIHDKGKSAGNGGEGNNPKGNDPKDNGQKDNSSTDGAEPYVLKGVVIDTEGRPIKGATIYADSMLLYNSNEAAVTDAKGRYRIELSKMATTWSASGQATIELNGVSSPIDLTPDNDDPFAGNMGAIRNFTALTKTGTVVFHMADLWDPTDVTLPPPEREDVELTLEPVGQTAGGAGKKIVGHGKVTNNGFGIEGVPIGRYKITARLVPDGKPAQTLLVGLLQQDDFKPALTADFENIVGAYYRLEIELKLP
ncbi:stalk domain-containing protein [Cohnella phaseoli]|uniref:Copper amine oxidase-like protein n=1 Tax=Cohnella phaseoli TaxID=456490 RepID=A0A3D9HSI2_9BACL|nr:stalk domain-containing protein [Cohnella phaseoli]RED51816.1 copper amine oxidase-like protein [Cohnella phaseoli]